VRKALRTVAKRRRTSRVGKKSASVTKLRSRRVAARRGVVRQQVRRVA
jgi:hypothetical protein